MWVCGSSEAVSPRQCPLPSSYPTHAQSEGKSPSLGWSPITVLPLFFQHIPLAIAIIFPILSLCQVLSYATTWLVLNGLFSSWVYLRFFQKNQQGSRGDMSEGFSFATFFPEPIQLVQSYPPHSSPSRHVPPPLPLYRPALARLAGFIYHLLVSAKVCPKIERTYDVGAPSRINLTLSGTDRVDAQRRKYVLWEGGGAIYCPPIQGTQFTTQGT